MGETSYSFLNSVVAFPIVIMIDLSLLLPQTVCTKTFGKNKYLSIYTSLKDNELSHNNFHLWLARFYRIGDI